MKRLPAPVVLFTVLGMVAVLALLDRGSGVRLSFSLFYLLPIGLGAWYGGRWIGLAAAAASGVACVLVSDSGENSLPPVIHAINLALRACAFLIAALLVAALRALTDRLEERVAEGTAALQRQTTERERAQDELRSNEELFRQLTENVGEVFWMTDPSSGALIYVSPAYEKVWGRSRAAVYQAPQSFIDSIHPEDRERVVAALKQQTLGGYDVQYRVVRPDGAVRWIWDRGFPIFDKSGAVYRVAGIAEDISKQKEADLALQKSELQLRLVWRNSLDGMRLMDEQGTLVSVNDAYCRMVELDQADLMGKPVSVIYAEERREEVLRKFCENFKHRTFSPHLEREILLWNGKRVYLEVSNSYLEIPGQPILLLSILRDISERKRAEAALKESEERFRVFMDNSPAVAFVKDERGRYLYVNATGEKRFHGLAVGQTDFDLFPPEVAERMRRDDQAVIAAGQTLEFQHSLSSPQGVVTDWLDFKFPFKDTAGRLFVGGVLVDITERRRLEKQILEISDREQGRIGQDLHDGLCQFLVGTAFDCNLLEERLAAAHRPESADAGKIAALLDEAITQARQLARGLFPVKLESDGLVSALEELAASVSSRFKLDCEVECTGAVSVDDNAVATHLYRIAQEAVSNAARHSRARCIRVRLVRSNGALELAVSDDGIGLSTENQTEGMGLHIMDYRIRTIGGTLTIQGGEGGGTTVLCSVPLANPSTMT